MDVIGSKSHLKRVYNVNIVYGTPKSENFQDYAQKPQRNCTCMNSASVDARFFFESWYSIFRRRPLRSQHLRNRTAPLLSQVSLPSASYFSQICFQSLLVPFKLVNRRFLLTLNNICLCCLQCSGSGSEPGSTYFWASRIRIH